MTEYKSGPVTQEKPIDKTANTKQVLSLMAQLNVSMVDLLIQGLLQRRELLQLAIKSASGDRKKLLQEELQEVRDQLVQYGA